MQFQFCMLLISIGSANRVVLMGTLYLIIGIISLVSWLILLKKPYIRHT